MPHVPCSVSYISIIIAVSIIISPVDINVRNENDSLLAVCVGLGYHQLSVYWSRNGDPIEPNSSRTNIYEENGTVAGRRYLQSILEVCSVSEMDAGLYECTATSALLNTSSNFRVTVGGELSVKPTHYHNHSIHVVRVSRVCKHCM